MARTKARENYGNGSVTPVMVKKLDKNGNPTIDKETGKPVMIQKKDRKTGKPTWRVCITLGTEEYLSKGKVLKRQKKKQEVYHGSLTDAREYCKQLVKKYAKLDMNSLGNTFKDAVDYWVKEEELKGKCAPSKLRDYVTRLGYVSPMLSTKSLLDVTQLDITAALQGAKDERNLSQRTLKDVFHLVKRVLGRAKAWKWIPENVMDDMQAPQAPESEERNYLSVDECSRFTQKLDESEEKAYKRYHDKEVRQMESGNTWGRSRIYELNNLSSLMAVRVMLATGCRRGEALGLCWENVDFEAKKIHIRKSLNPDMVLKTTKTKNGIRSISVDNSTMTHLLKWKKLQATALHLIEVTDEDGREQTFQQTDGTPVACSSEGGFINPHTMSRWWNSYRKAIGFPTLRMHELRHTQASLLIANKMDLKTIQVRMGHADIKVTINTYGHLIPQNDRDAAEFMGSIFTTQPKEGTMLNLAKAV